MSGEMEKIRKKLDEFEEKMTHTRHFWWIEIFRISFLNREYYYKGRLNLVSCVTNVRLNLSADNFNSMKQTRKPGQPREWVLNEETIEIHKLSTKLKTQNPRAHWSAINDMLKTQLEQMGRKDLLLKIDKLWGLMRPVIPLPPKCICGNRIYSYTYNKIENEYEHYWEIFARCVNPTAVT